MKSTSQNKASFTTACRTRSPFIVSVPLLFTLTYPRDHTVMAARPRVEHLTPHTITFADISQVESLGDLRQEAFQVQTHTVSFRLRRWRSMVSHCMATFRFFILSIL